LIITAVPIAPCAGENERIAGWENRSGFKKQKDKYY
jgi:hypothetical protein